MASTYYIDNIKYTDTYNLLDSGALHDSNHKLSGTTGNFETTGTIKANTGIFNELIAVNLNARNATIDELTAQNATVMGIMDVKGKLMTNSWEAASIANVGGNFYISPTGKDTGTPNITITCNSVSSGAGTYTITVSKGGSSGQGNGFGVSSTNSSLWSKGSRVLMTGNVKFGTKNYPLGSLDGIVSTGNNGIVISSNLITSITLTSVVSSALDLIFTEQSTLAANQSLSGTSNGSNMQISLYQNKTGSYFYPIGILLSSYGQSDKQQYIDIYNGSIRLGRNASDTANVTTGMAEPVVRIGDLEGLPNIVDNSSNENTRPTGWGIYTTNGFFKGKVVANAGLIATWNIGSTSIYSGTSSMTSITPGTYIGTGTDSTSGIRNYQNATTFVNISQGIITAKGANIQGTIDAASFIARADGKIRAQVNSTGLLIYDATGSGNIPGNIMASFGLDNNKPVAIIGLSNNSQSYMRLDSNALQMIDKEGHLYFEVKDLRENGEFATVSESFPILASENNPSLPDINTYYVLKGSVAATSNVIGVKINGTSISNWQASVQPTGMCIKFTSTSGLTVGDIATVSYQTSGSNLKALTFGSRGSSNLYYPGGYSVAMGDEVIAEGDYSFASGYHTKAYGIYSAAMGMETIAGKAGQVAIGEYNERDNDALFVIGNGIADDNRSNLMVVGDNFIRIGNLGTSHLLMDYHSLQMIDKEGNTYFEVKDLRNNNGTVTLTVDYISDGTTTTYSLSPPADNTNYTVTVNDNSGSGMTKYTYGVTFSVAPLTGATITITYTTSSILSKAYTFGLRNSDSKQGALSISEGYLTEASGSTSHAEGNSTKAKGHHSHAEGDSTIASSLNCHAEGSNTQANGLASHAEGCYTIAGGGYSHAEGYHTTAGGWGSHAEGYYTTATGVYSHTSGYYTIAASQYQTAIGRYNISDSSNTYAFIIGNGSGDATANRSNALTVDWNGNIMAQGMAGMVQMFAGSTAPTGWLICDGTAVSRTTYATLFAVIGITYGAGDGSTTFNLPNLQGRVAIGVSSSHTLASTGGAETVTLTAAQSGVPAHSHTATGSEYFVCNDLATANNANVDLHTSGTARRADALNSTANVWHHNRSTANNTAANASAAHNNMQPFITMNYIICTGKTN